MKEEEFENYVIKYLQKKRVVRFNDLLNWLSTVMKEPPSKATVSIKLDKMAEEGKIISWNDKGARYISLPCSRDEIKKTIIKKMQDLSLKKNKVTINDIYEGINLPKDIVIQAITDLVSEGKIINAVSDGVTYYKLQPIHVSIKVGISVIVLLLLLYLFADKIGKDILFIISLLAIIVMTFLWYKVKK